MKVDDNLKNTNANSAMKPRVSFALPGEPKNLTEANTALRLTTSRYRPSSTNSSTQQQYSDKSVAGNLVSGKNKVTETRKAGSSNHGSIPTRSSSVKKYFVRDSELPVHKLTQSQCSVKSVGGQGILKKNLLTNGNNVAECRCDVSRCQPKCKSYRSECGSPELLSTLSIAKKIQYTAEALKEPRANIYSLNPLVEQEIEEKASNRLNFPFDELVYRDLVTLNIRDEELAGSNRTKCKCSRDFESQHLKDEEPVLSEFFQPRSGEEYSSVIFPMPCSIDKVRRFNGLAIYNKMHFWE